MIQFTNLSPSTDIGSNSYLIEWEGTNIIFDAGMHPKKEGNAAKPNYESISGTAPDSIFITHSHLDHIGTLPVLQEMFPTSPVYMTAATAVVSSAMLHNSVNVMTSMRIQDGIVEYPFYTHSELDDAEKSWQCYPYEESFRIGGRNPLLATLYDAGHILGSCGVLLEAEDGKTIFYTGDVQFDNQSLIPGASFPESGVDVLILESTHGNTHRCAKYTREGEMQRFAQAISDGIERGGAVLIPVFALGKSQELLFEINRMREEGRIPNVPIYFGGLSTKITLIYDKLSELTPRLHPGYRLKQSIQTLPIPRKGKDPLVASAGNIYLVSSGMMSEHTVSHSLGEQLLPRKNDTILFVGYSDPQTPAGIIKAASKGESVQLRSKSKQATNYNCHTDQFDFSGHASRQDLIDYAVKLAPESIVLVHGDPPALESMQKSLTELLPNTTIHIAEAGKTIQI